MIIETDDCQFDEENISKDWLMIELAFYYS